MKKFLHPALFALLFPLTAFAMNSHLIFLGTYTRTTGKGIYAVRLDDDTGALSTPFLVAETPSPTWITFSPDKKFLYANYPSAAQAIGFRVADDNGKLVPLAPPLTVPAANAPSHLAVDATGRTLLAANYADGFVAALPINTDGTLGAPNIIRHSGHGPNPLRQDRPHPHSVTLSPDNRFVIVCDLGLDRIYSYALDPIAAKLTPANPPFVEAMPTSGPRHFKFGPDGRHAYNLTEMGSTVVAYDYAAATGALTPIQTIVTLPPSFEARWAAEVRIHPNGKFLYASNRGHDSLAVFAIDPATDKLTLVEIVPSGGKVPRNFAFSPDGKWLVCGHQDSENLTVFRVDAATGRLTRAPGEASVSMCVCVLFYN